MLSSITACIPWLPTNAEAVLALRSPASLLLDVQPAKLPDSNPSAKITSNPLEVFVAVGVFEGVGVFVGVRDGPTVAVFVGVGVLLGVSVNVGVLVGPGVLEGVAVGNGPVFNKLKPSKSLLVCAQVLPSRYNAGEYVQAVTLPRDVGAHTNTSSSSPDTPVTENSPVVDR